jgi:8-oxo-dGTP pyrophosphatase MutT (NUDIX family)
MTHRVIDPPDPFLRALQALLAPLDAPGRFRRGARSAAVAVALFRREGEWRLPFVTRREDLPDHPGQVAFPGGTVRAGEGAWEAAEREAYEEIGVPPGTLVPLGAGAAVYTAASNFSVVPFVAWLPAPDPAFVVDAGELRAVLEIPLASLLVEEAWLEGLERFGGAYFPWETSIVWGLTARILADLMPRFRDALAAAGPAPGPPAARQ